MIEPGRKAPAFAAQDDGGRTVCLKDFAGRTVVLYFYPKDDTSGCTTQACGLRDAWDRIRSLGAVVFGISPDGVASHERFRNKYTLPFSLLADPDHAIAEAYGVWGEKSMYGRKYFGIHRTTFIIDGKGVVREVLRKVKPKGHADQVVKALEKSA